MYVEDLEALERSTRFTRDSAVGSLPQRGEHFSQLARHYEEELSPQGRAFMERVQRVLLGEEVLHHFAKRRVHPPGYAERLVHNAVHLRTTLPYATVVPELQLRPRSFTPQLQEAMKQVGQHVLNPYDVLLLDFSYQHLEQRLREEHEQALQRTEGTLQGPEGSAFWSSTLRASTTWFQGARVHTERLLHLLDSWGLWAPETRETLKQHNNSLVPSPMFTPSLAKYLERALRVAVTEAPLPWCMSTASEDLEYFLELLLRGARIELLLNKDLAREMPWYASLRAAGEEIPTVTSASLEQLERFTYNAYTGDLQEAHHGERLREALRHQVPAEGNVLQNLLGYARKRTAGDPGGAHGERIARYYSALQELAPGAALGVFL